MNMYKKKSLILSISGIISILLITLGITYAFFNYAKTGTTENVISSGSITFIYEEIDKQGSGILIENAYPMSDSDGKLMSNTNEVFNFKIKSTTASKFKIPYTVTARKDSNSTLDSGAVRMYLTEVNETSETEILLDNYSNLPVYDKVGNEIEEKVIYEGVVPVNSTNYEKNFRLRMWIDSDTDFSPDENDNYEMNNKTFKVNVNVYSNAKVVTNEEIYEVYNIGDSVTLIDGSKWHVLENSYENTETVVLLSDYNLNSDGTYNTECGRNIDNNYYCNTMEFDSDNTNDYNETDNNNIGYFIKNTYGSKVLTKLPKATNITLPTANQIATANNLIFENAIMDLDKPWLLTTNYWTKTTLTPDSNILWSISGEISSLNNTYARRQDLCGARPTITVPKEYIVKTLSVDTKLMIGDSVTAIDGSKWHVLEESDSTSKYVTLLSDYNLNSDGTYNTNCGRDINGNFNCSPIAFDDNNTQTYDEIDNNNIGYFIKNTYTPNVTKLLFETKNITLPTASQIAKADSQSFDQNYLTLTNSWLTSTNYWTITKFTTNNYGVWIIYGINSALNGSGGSDDINYGARPVITTLKTNLLAN